VPMRRAAARKLPSSMAATSASSADIFMAVNTFGDNQIISRIHLRHLFKVALSLENSRFFYP